MLRRRKELSITGHSTGAALELYMVRLLSTFLCAELICAVSLLPRILYTCSSQSYSHTTQAFMWQPLTSLKKSL